MIYSFSVSVFPQAHENFPLTLYLRELLQGTLKDGTEIAVKKIGSSSTVTPDKQFQNEVGNLMAIRHDNIVKLVGFCYETKKTVVEHNGRYILADIVESLLCYEYMKMGSLEKHIFGIVILDYYPRLSTFHSLSSISMFLTQEVQIISLISLLSRNTDITLLFFSSINTGLGNTLQDN